MDVVQRTPLWSDRLSMKDGNTEGEFEFETEEGYERMVFGAER